MMSLGLSEEDFDVVSGFCRWPYKRSVNDHDERKFIDLPSDLYL